MSHYCRVSIHTATCTKALGFVRDFVQKNAEELYVLKDIFDLYKSTRDALRSMNVTPEKHVQILVKAMASMGELFSKLSLNIPCFSLDKIRTEFRGLNSYISREEQGLTGRRRKMDDAWIRKYQAH